MKTFIKILLYLSSVVSSIVSIYAQTPNPLLTLGGPSGKIAPGSSVTISVGLTLPTGATVPTGIQWGLTYSADDISSVVWSTGAASTAVNKTVTCNSATPGKSTCISIGQNVTPFGAGEVAKVVLTVKPTSTAQNITVTLGNTFAADPTGSAVTLVASAAVYTIKLGTCDVTGDGLVDAADFGSAMSQALGLDTCSTADIDGNGKCDIVDVVRIMIAANGGQCRVF